jgi:deazaflavin-dependent oxidoreductase (nitroreductase family)
MTAQTRVPSFVPIFNTVASRLLRLGPLMGPNALLSVRGRKSGEVRTTPVALVEAGGKRWTIGMFGDVNWVRNLRAAGEGTITVGRRTERVRAVELAQVEAGSFFADVVRPFAGTRLKRWMLGSVLGGRDIFDDPHGAAARRPVFELLAAAPAAVVAPQASKRQRVAP